MDLTNYWKALAAPEAYGKECLFFNNGFFAIADDKKGYWNVFDPQGRLFMPANISDGKFKVLGCGIMAAKAASGWTFIKPDKQVLYKTERDNINILDYHSFCVTEDNGKTYLYFLEKPEDEIELGYGITEVNDSPGTLIAFKRYLRGNVYWHLTNPETEMNIHLRKAENVRFFDNGSYLIEFGDNLLLMNDKNEKVFSCKKSTTFFVLQADGNYFQAMSCARTCGTYDALNRKRASAEMLEFISPTGASYQPKQMLVLANGEKINAAVFSECGMFGKELVYIRFNRWHFVLDTLKSKEEMRKLIREIIKQKNEPDKMWFDYFNYLIYLLQ